MNAYGTNFIESEALLALTCDDEDYAAKILAKLSIAELKALCEAVDVYREMIHSEIVQKARGLAAPPHAEMIDDLRLIASETRPAGGR